MHLEEVLLRCATVAKSVIGPQAAVTDAARRWPKEGLRELLNAGLGGLVVPSAKGGLGHGLLGLAKACETLGQECASSALCFGMHHVAAAVIAAKASPRQVERYVEPIVRGQHLTTLSLSEHGTGAHFYYPQARLQRYADEYHLNGEKTFVTNGGHADSYVVSTAAADANAPVGRFSCVAVESTDLGVFWGSAWDGLGMRGNSAKSMKLQNVRLPQERLLGDEGDQIWYIFEIVAPYFLTAMAGSYLGIATAALRSARTHLIERTYEHSGASLAQHPVLQHRLGALWSRLESSRQLIYHAASIYDAGATDAMPAVLSAKAEMGDTAIWVVNEAMTLMGGVAYRQHSDMHRYLRDARAAHVMAPTTDILRTWTGRALLEQPLLAD